MKKHIVVISCSLFLLFLLPQPSLGFTFTKDVLITDKELTDGFFSAKGLQDFLEEKGSILASVSAKDIDGEEKKVSRILYAVSEKYHLNPMLFLVMAQKESSAITSKRLTYPIEHWLLGFGRCDSCSEGDAAAYRGITKQLYAAGEAFRNGYLQDLEGHGYTISGWGPGITKITIDGIAVTPQNNATAALYTYNPCVGAYGGGTSAFGCNSAFQKLWQEWSPPAKYPNGTLLNIRGVVYLIQNGKKRPFTSRSALVANYDIRRVIAVSTVVGELYEDGVPITFPNYALLRNPAGTVYLLVDGEKRGIVSKEVFRELGFHEEEIIDAAWKEIEPIPEGKPITENVAFPNGILFQNNATGAIAYIDSEGVRHDIWSKKILENRFLGRRILLKDEEEITQWPKGDPIRFLDGTLLKEKSSQRIFVIADGKRRRFDSEKVFLQLGYQKKQIVSVSRTILRLHPKGKPITLQTDKEKK